MFHPHLAHPLVLPVSFWVQRAAEDGELLGAAREEGLPEHRRGHPRKDVKRFARGAFATFIATADTAADTADTAATAAVQSLRLGSTPFLLVRWVVWSEVDKDAG